ncbi:MAG: hypothetical protein H6766_02185 [Candidatus Peribacteria bacterium]|nr:MAG: hypothetical protein H6766_02185 [Candidatus Peribacteria bacterium]
MPTIIHIHGGEARDNDSEFIQFLHDLPLDLSHEKTKKRSRKYDEIFPNTKSYRPEMPCAFNAKYTQRKIRFEKYLEQISDELILIGHSLGANFLAKRLAENHIKQYSCTIQQLHLVA